jgi:hypothetical protein
VHAGPLPGPGAGTVKLLYVADMGAGPARPDEIGGALDSEGLAINRENSGPKSGGRLVVEGLLRRENLAEYSMVLHNGDLSYACGESLLHEAFGSLSHGR